MQRYENYFNKFALLSIKKKITMGQIMYKNLQQLTVTSLHAFILKSKLTLEKLILVRID